MHSPALRITTWLAPSLPLALFRLLASAIADQTHRPVELTSETALSGPRPWLDDPFRRRQVDVGFLCSPSWAWLAEGPQPSVQAICAAPVPLDPRAQDRPVYFSDVIVPAASRAGSIADLAGSRWAYNDSCSLSGWFAMRAHVPHPESFFAQMIHSGSHLASIRLVVEGKADGAAIDSTVLGWVHRADPTLTQRIRIVESFGPHPIQPVVARIDLDPAVVDAVAFALASFDPVEGARSALAPFGLAGFARMPPVPLDQRLLDEIRLRETARSL